MQPPSLFARTHLRRPHRTFGISQPDRLFHTYVVGKTGAGKSTLIENVALQDIRAGRGCAVIDPHGDMAERLARDAKAAGRDLIYIDAADPHQPYGYNPLRRVGRQYIPLVASSLMDTLHALWGESAWGVRMEHILRNTLYALLEYGEATFPDILRLPVDKEFRAEVLAAVENEAVRTFWLEEWERYPAPYKRDACAPIENKIGAFLADPRLYRMLTTPPIDVRVSQVMNDGAILIVNLAKGRLGTDSARLLGALLVGMFCHAALARAAQPLEERLPFNLIIDEFQNVVSEAVVSMVSELRKFKVGLTLAHQHLHQLPEDVLHAVFANMGTVIAFRLGALDAPVMARHFGNAFSADDLTNLPYRTIALSLMVDGQATQPFSADTLPRMNVAH